MNRPSLAQLRNADLDRLLGAQGRRGDTMVAHLNPQEAGLLKMLGGSGTRNPRTGLLEFFAGGPGGVGRDSGGAVAGGASGIGGSRGRGEKGAGPNHGGSSNENAKQGHLGAGYGSGSQTGISQGDIDKMVTGGDYSSPGFGVKRGITGDASLGHTPDQRGILDVLGDIASGAWKGLKLGSTIGGFGGPQTGILGGGLGLIGGGIYGGIEGSDGLGDGMTRGQNAGAPDKSGGGNNAGPSSGAGSGSESGGGFGMGGSGPGNIPGSLAAAAQQAAIDRAAAIQPQNTGLVAAPSPTVPAGLLQYLAQNPGLIQGLTSTSRFGTGSVAPVNYMRAYA